MFGCVSRLDNDSQDEASKAVSQAERELEEIRKVIQESGGKLSNRGLQTEVGDPPSSLSSFSICAMDVHPICSCLTHLQTYIGTIAVGHLTY